MRSRCVIEYNSSYYCKSFMRHRSRVILFYGEKRGEGTEGKRVPSGRHGIAVSDP